MFWLRNKKLNFRYALLTKVMGYYDVFSLLDILKSLKNHGGAFFSWLKGKFSQVIMMPFLCLTS